MPLKKYLPLAALLTSSLIASQACAQMVSEKGMTHLVYSGHSASAAERQTALGKAELNAVDRYFAEGDESRSNLYESRRNEIAAHIDDYILDTTPISESSDKSSKTYTLVIDADINANRLLSDLGAGANSAATTSMSAHGLMSFLFVARSQSSVQSFAARITRRTDTDQSDDRATHEGEGIRAHEVDTSEGSREHTSATTTSGGSSLQQADRISWTVGNAGEIDTAMTGVFTDAGYQVIDADQVEGASGGLVNVGTIRDAYSHGDDLPAKLMYSTTQGAERAGIDYLALGTLDVGMPQIDPVSGNTRVFVVVTGKVLYVKGRFARTVASVGPIQYAGLGPDPSVARINALKNAAGQAAHQMVDALADKAIH